MQATDNKVDTILARYPGPVVLKPSRKRLLLLVATSAVLAAGGVDMVAKGTPQGLSVLIFFAVCLVVISLLLLPGAAGLILDADGFKVTNLFCSYRSRWQDVNEFAPISMPYVRRRMVGYDIITIGSTVGALTTAIAGRNASLPDTYGFSADELADLMRRWRERATAA